MDELEYIFGQPVHLKMPTKEGTTVATNIANEISTARTLIKKSLETTVVGSPIGKTHNTIAFTPTVRSA